MQVDVDEFDSSVMKKSGERKWRKKEIIKDRGWRVTLKYHVTSFKDFLVTQLAFLAHGFQTGLSVESRSVKSWSN